jgi:alpha-galactosidase
VEQWQSPYSTSAPTASPLTPSLLSLAKLGLKGPEAGKDLWTGKDVTLTDNEPIELASHDILLVRIA